MSRACRSRPRPATGSIPSWTLIAEGSGLRPLAQLRRVSGVSAAGSDNNFLSRGESRRCSTRDSSHQADRATGSKGYELGQAVPRERHPNTASGRIRSRHSRRGHKTFSVNVLLKGNSGFCNRPMKFAFVAHLSMERRVQIRIWAIPNRDNFATPISRTYDPAKFFD